jgi:hypothetical protein
MKKGVWNEIIYRLSDKGITHDPDGIYTIMFQKDDDNKSLVSLGWTDLIQSLYDETDKHGIDEIFNSAFIERKYRVQ